MPEASSDLNRLASSRKNNVGPARQIPDMNAEAVAQGVQQTTQTHFGRGVFVADSLHVASAGGRYIAEVRALPESRTGSLTHGLPTHRSLSGCARGAGNNHKHRISFLVKYKSRILFPLQRSLGLVSGWTEAR